MLDGSSVLLSRHLVLLLVVLGSVLDEVGVGRGLHDLVVLVVGNAVARRRNVLALVGIVELLAL